MPRRAATLIAALSLAFLTLWPGTATAARSSGDVTNFFHAHLSSAQEVPQNDSRARGAAILRLSHDGEELHYRVLVAKLENVTMAHIHLAPPGVNGDIVAWLYPSQPPPVLIPGTTNGTLQAGTVTAADLVGPLAGQPLDALIDEIRAGNAYVNIHTSQFPGGEIRGVLK